MLPFLFGSLLLITGVIMIIILLFGIALKSRASIIDFLLSLIAAVFIGFGGFIINKGV